MKYFITTILSVLFSGLMTAQVKYDRNSISLLFIDSNERYATEIFKQANKLKLPEKTFINKLKSETIKFDIRRVSPLDYMQFIDKKLISKQMNNKKIGQQILSVWFNRQKDGTMNTETLKQRGLYNANDNESIIASSSKRGISKLMDMGLNLIEQSYIILLDFYNITSYDEFYDHNQTPSKERTQTGYIAKGKAYIMKLEFDNNTASDFFQNYWISPNDPEKKIKVNRFNKAKFNFKFYSEQNLNVQAYQNKKINKYIKRKTKDDFFQELAQKAFDNILDKLTSENSSFNVKAMISSVKPISAKIGKKEDIGFEDRFFVYEKRLKKGKIKPKRVGVVKAYKIVDNRKLSKGNTESSSFYQIAGKKIDDQGMYLVYKKNLGYNIYGGISSKGYYLRGDYYISKYLKNFVKTGHSGKWLTSLSLYAEADFGDKAYQWDIGNVMYSSLYMGISKSFYPSRKFHITPFAGFGFETASWDALGENDVKESKYEYGLRFGLNLRHNIQLMVDWGYNNNYGNATLEDSDGNTIEDYYGNAFNGRTGTAYSFGIRLMF